MKAVIPLIFILLSFFACRSPAYLSGKLEGTENKKLKVYVIQPSKLREFAASYFGKVIDSAAVMKDGSFEFHNTPKAAEPIVLELALQESSKYPNFLETDDPSKSNYMPIVWKKGNAIHFTAKAGEFQKSFSMKYPSAENKSLLALRDINQNAYQNYLAGKVWQIEDGSQILEKEEAVLNYKRP